MMLPAAYLACIAGGNLGGESAEYIVGRTGIPFDLTAGIAAVLSCVVAIGSLTGALFGKALVVYVFEK